MKAWTLAALAWAALISAAGRSEPAAAWLAMGTIALAPLALAILASLIEAEPERVAAAEAQALAWSQCSHRARRPPGGRAVPAAAGLARAQPLPA